MDLDQKEQLSRRQALEKLAKLSVYTAPTVVTMLSASSSYAAGSCPTNQVDQLSVQISRADMGRRRDRTDVTIREGDGSRTMLGGRNSTADCMV